MECLSLNVGCSRQRAPRQTRQSADSPATQSLRLVTLCSLRNPSNRPPIRKIYLPASRPILHLDNPANSHRQYPPPF
jgi:hypothetical protein